MGNGRKGGESTKATDDHVTDLAVKMFSGKAATDNERTEATPDDEHAERHDYYRNLIAKQKSGKALTDTERQWMQQAVDAHHKVTRQGQLPGEISKFNVDDAAMKAFGTGSPYMGMPRGREMQSGKALTPGEMRIDNTNNKLPVQDSYDPVALSGTMQGTALQNLEALQRPGINPAFSNGYMRGLSNPETQVGSPMQQNQLGQPPLSPKQFPGGRVTIYAHPGDPMGADETGAETDLFGKYTGTVDNPKGADSRYLYRGPEDVYADDKDAYATKLRKGKTALEDSFGKHLDAVEENDGKYPGGYFKGMDPKKKQEIKDGVQQLMKERKGEKA
jgi:hypothetical protein